MRKKTDLNKSRNHTFMKVLKHKTTLLLVFLKVLVNVTEYT